MHDLTIRTSSPGWVSELARAYRQRRAVVLVDDADAGVHPSRQSLLEIGLKSRLSPREWSAVAVSTGFGLLGAWMVVAAVLDPEPTSKLSLLVASGAVLALTGGWNSVRLLTSLRPPNVKISPRGIEIEWS